MNQATLFRRGRKPSAFLMAGALSLGVVGVTMASASYSAQGIDDGGFWVCIEKTTKVVRYVSSGVCGTNEALRWWKGQGPAGATGPAGADGATGAAGATGPAGADGATGPAGADGATGPAGPAGADGADGATGPAGADGATGPAGADGAAGPAGADGATGPAGADGATGPAGADGATGPAGADGATGPAGPAGADGATGPAGADGATGPAGADGADGSDGTDGTDGADGVSGWESRSATSSSSSTWPRTQTVSCTGSKKLLGGGYSVSSGADETQIAVSANGPTSDTTWSVTVYDDASSGSIGTATLTAYAFCATAN